MVFRQYDMYEEVCYNEPDENKQSKTKQTKQKQTKAKQSLLDTPKQEQMNALPTKQPNPTQPDRHHLA